MMIRKTVPSQGPVTTPALGSDPITQPLYGSAAPQEPSQPQANSWAGFQPAPVQPESYQPPVPGYSGFQPSEPAPVSQPAPAAPAPVTAAPPAPIPAEHQVIQDTLESLRAKCQQVSAHPQVRRKLEDVSQKLDILYD